MDFFYNAIRGFFFQLDGVIYGLIDDVYSLLLLITRTSIFGMDEIANFSERIFALAGIFMLFKVSLSIINYVINPDDFTKEEKGFSSLLKRIVFTLALLVITPFIFQEAYEIQAIILEDNTIMHLVFGTPTQDRLPNENYVEAAGRDIQFTVMYAFLQPNVAEFFATGDKNFSACTSVYQLADNGLIMRRSDSNYIYALNPECFGTYNEGSDMYDCNTPFCEAFSESTSSLSANAADIYQTYAQAVAQRNFSLLVRKDLVLVEYNGKYVIDYKFLISTAVGVAVIYLLLLFCIDIAVRSVKLGFLEMIAPIPILSYIDPKSGSDKGMFKSWVGECVSTYVGLFLRLFALYIGIYAITIIGGYTDFVTGDVIQGNWLLDVFMILGILIFAKQLPEILKNALGLKLDGKFKLNPLKKIEEEALGGKAITRTGGALAAGTAAGAAAFGANLISSKGNPLSAIAGAIGAGRRGVAGGLKGDKFGKNFTNSYGGAMQAKQARADRHDDGVGWAEMQAAKFAQATGGHTKGEAVKSATEKSKKIQDTYSAMRNAAVGNDKNTFGASDTDFQAGGKYNKYAKLNAATGRYEMQGGIKALEKYADELKKTSINRDSYANENDYLTAVREQQERIADIEDIRDNRLNSLAAGTTTTGDAATDHAITEAYATMRSLAGDVNSSTRAFDSDIGIISTTADAKTINGTSKGVSSQIAGSTKANHATTVENYAAKKGQK